MNKMYNCISCGRAPAKDETFTPIELYRCNRNSATAGNRYICSQCLKQHSAADKELANTVHPWQVRLEALTMGETENAIAELSGLGIDDAGRTVWQPSTRSIVKVCRSLSRLHYTHQLKILEVNVTMKNLVTGEIWERTYSPNELKSATFTDCTKCRKARIDRGFEQIV